MHYFIDGYNLMFRMGAGDNLRSEREKIISQLFEKIELLQLNVSLIFDSQYQEGLGTRSHIDFMEICFTDEGETADDYIINELQSSQNPREEIVVTSDNNLAWRARRMHAKTEHVEEFMRWLDHRYRKKKKSIPQKATKQIKKTVIPESFMSPVAKETAQKNYGFYLKEFEKKFQEAIQKEQKRKPKPKKTEKRTNENEAERWLRLFEEKMRDDEE